MHTWSYKIAANVKKQACLTKFYSADNGFVELNIFIC